MSQKKIIQMPVRGFGRGEFPLAVLRQMPQRPIALHIHQFTELVLILSGRGRHFCEKDEYEIVAGDCFVVSGAHGYKDTENLCLINIVFFHEQLGLPLKEARKLPGFHAFFAIEPRFRRRHKFRGCLRLTPDELIRASAVIDRMEKELLARGPGHEFVSLALLMDLIGMLARAYAGMKRPAARPLLQLGNVLSFLEGHYAEPVRLDQLARIANMSKAGLLRAFRVATGYTPIDYLIRLRIRRACDLLRAGDMNITEAALHTGFDDSNYFARQFRRVAGCAPRAYRRLHNGH